MSDDQDSVRAQQQAAEAQQQAAQAQQQSAQSVSAMSSNILSQIAQMQAAMAMPQQQNVSPMMNMNAMQSAMYAGSTMPFSPQNMMAQDMYQQQMMMMGPSGAGYGPSMTTPTGMATINPFQSPGAPSYQLPTSQMQQFGSPGQPGDPTRSRLFFGTGSGSVFNAMRQTLPGLIRGTPGFGNDNLEDLMSRNAERQQQYMAENVFNVGAGVASFGASTAAFSMGQKAAKMGAARLGIGGMAGGVLGFGGGMVAGAVFDAGYGYLENREGAYREGAKDLRDYTSPYIRGSRPGGGMSYKETLGMERDLAKQVGRDNFFNAQDYKTLISMAGETGMFQSTGSQDQAMKAIDNMSKSVKTLFALGVKSREHLQAIDTAFNQFGVSAGADPTKLANLFQTFASTAQSAGMSTGQMVQAVAPAAQAAMAQGLGPQAGALMAAQNQGIAGGMFRSGALGGFDQAYFGGAQGFGNTLTQAQFSMARAPMGQIMTAGLFAPGSRTMGNLMAGKPIGPMEAMSSMSGYAANPLGYIGMQARLPELTQNLGPQLQIANIQMGIQAYKQMGLKTDHGRIAPNDFLGFLISVYGMPQNEALAMVKMLDNAQGAATDIRRSARDQQINLQMEGLRRPSLRRTLEKMEEHYVDPIAVGLFTSGREASSDFVDAGARAVGGLFGRNVKDYAELSTGVRIRDLGANGYLQDTTARVKAQTEQRALMKNLGYARTLDTESADQTGSAAEARAAGDLFNKDSGFRTAVAGGLHRAGVNLQDAGMEKLLRAGTASDEEIDDVSNSSDLFRGARAAALQGVSDPAARRAVSRAMLQQYRGIQTKERYALTAFNKTADNAMTNAISMVQSDKGAAAKYLAGITETTTAGEARQLVYKNIIAADPGKYGNKTVDEVHADGTLGPQLGSEAKAVLEGLAAQNKNKTSGDGTAYRTDKQLTLANQGFAGMNGGGEKVAGSVVELSDQLKQERHSGWAATVVDAAGASFQAGIIGAGAMLGVVNPVLGLMGMKAGQLGGGLVRDWANKFMANSENDHGLNKVLGGDVVQAETSLRIGANAALRNAVDNSKTYAELKQKLKDGGLSDPEITRLLASSGIKETGYDSKEIHDRLGKQQEGDIGRLKGDQATDVLSMIKEIDADTGAAGGFAKSAYRGYERAARFNAKTGYELDTKQADRLRDMFVKPGESAKLIEQINSGSDTDLAAAAETILKNGQPDNPAAVKAAAALAKMGAGNAGEKDKATIEAAVGAGKNTETFLAADGAGRTDLLHQVIGESVAGAKSKGEETDRKFGSGDGLTKETAEAMRDATNQQLKVADAYSKLSESFSKDNTESIVTAMKGMSDVIGKPGEGEGSDTFKGAVEKFKKAVELMVKRPAPVNYPAAKQPPQGKDVPKAANVPLGGN